jgi:hypothetical protein
LGLSLRCRHDARRGFILEIARSEVIMTLARFAVLPGPVARLFRHGAVLQLLLTASGALPAQASAWDSDAPPVAAPAPLELPPAPPSELPALPPVLTPESADVPPVTAEHVVVQAPPIIVDAPRPPAAAPADGQWVFTHQYGWIWLPYDRAYTYVPADGYPAMFVYDGTLGWRWVAAPWVFGWGPTPHWGARGPAYFSWHARPWFAPRVYRREYDRGYSRGYVRGHSRGYSRAYHADPRGHRHVHRQREYRRHEPHGRAVRRHEHHGRAHRRDEHRGREHRGREHRHHHH